MLDQVQDTIEPVDNAVDNAAIGNLDLVRLTSDVVAAFVAHNKVPSGEVSQLIHSVHQALEGVSAPAATTETKPQAMVTVRKSLSNPDHIVSMIDGKPYKMLKRHLANHGYTPESYREAFDLPRDYPMVSQAYTSQRRDIAHKVGLGRKA